MNLDGIRGLFDMLSLEADAFSEAVERADSAATTSELLMWTHAAIESAFSCIEICGRLRDVDPEGVVSTSNVWRDAVRDLTIAAHEIAEARRAELSSFGSELAR